MPINRFFYELGPLTGISHAQIEGTEFHHLAHVTRTKEGETVELVDGKGNLAHSVVKDKSKHAATLELTHIQTTPPPSFVLILAQAIPRLNRLETIIEKGTELGMTELWLFPGILGEAKPLKENQLDRLEKIAIGALKQCGRLYLPKITCIAPILEWTSSSYPLFFGDLSHQSKNLYQAWNPSEKGAILCIGPESGFHPKEVEKLTSLKGKPVKLHSNILRTDTASIAALSIASQFIIN